MTYCGFVIFFGPLLGLTLRELNSPGRSLCTPPCCCAAGVKVLAIRLRQSCHPNRLVGWVDCHLFEDHFVINTHSSYRNGMLHIFSASAVASRRRGLLLRQGPCETTDALPAPRPREICVLDDWHCASYAFHSYACVHMRLEFVEPIYAIRL